MAVVFAVAVAVAVVVAVAVAVSVIFAVAVAVVPHLENRHCIASDVSLLPMIW